MNDEGILINADLHLKTVGKLTDAIHQGLGSLETSDEDKKKLAQLLKQNIYPFSAAKSFTQMQYYRDMMMGDDGKLLSKSAFIKKIADTGEIFNKKYLSAEYENAYYSTLMVDKWERFTEDDWLQYSTVGDDNVRPSHAILDKYTAPKSDSFWKNNYPPNGWGCRCTVVPGKPSHVNKLTEKEAGQILKEENKNTPFYNNAGISKVIFKGNHPYFINNKGKETNLNWKQYGLHDIDKIRSFELPEYKNSTLEDYFSWWDKQPKINGQDFILQDVMGNTILFDSAEGTNVPLKKKFKHHILHKTHQNRFKFGTEINHVLTKPNEIWFNPKDGSHIYVKYYKQGTLKLVVKEGKAITFYQLYEKDSGESNQARQGVLMYRN